MTIEEKIEIKNKVLYGLKKTYEKLLADTKLQNAELVVLRDNEIVRIKPK